jgi:hypothetical protein
MILTYEPAKRASKTAMHSSQSDGLNASRPNLRTMSYDEQVACLSPDAQNVQMEEGEPDTGMEADIRKKLEALFDKLGGTEPAFKEYSNDGTLEGTVDIKGIESILKDAGVGWLVRNLAKDKILEKFDLDASGTVTWSEFTQVLEVADEIEAELDCPSPAHRDV